VLLSCHDKNILISVKIISFLTKLWQFTLIFIQEFWNLQTVAHVSLTSMTWPGQSDPISISIFILCEYFLKIQIRWKSNVQYGSLVINECSLWIPKQKLRFMSTSWIFQIQFAERIYFNFWSCFNQALFLHLHVDFFGFFYYVAFM